MIIAGALFLVAYLSFVSKPVTPELDWLIARATQGIIALLSGFSCFTDAQGDVEEAGMEVMGLFTTLLATGKWAISKVGAFHSWWKRNQAPQFLKILITYFQVSQLSFTYHWSSLPLFRSTRQNTHPAVSATRNSSPTDPSIVALYLSSLPSEPLPRAISDLP